MVGQRVSYPDYEDWLEEIDQKGGPFRWIMQDRDFPLNSSKCSKRQRSLDEVNVSVLNSTIVQETIVSEARRRGCSESVVAKEAEEMLVTMAHRYGLRNVRTLGYLVAKVFTRIFDGIYVNAPQLRKIRELSRTTPVVFMPSHRTYLDFLLVSLMCFNYEITLPAIAAGQDFMNMAVLGAVLRRCGAFFMRRSFGKDKLYWAVFSEYVQTHLTNGDRPVEFFVEGTRSRVGKSLHPKYGLIQMVMEPFLKGDVYDTIVVPVAMNYDKILEEMLYAYELLGFSKPKESTSGLFKAREVLDRKFGKCFMTFGEPISIREKFGPKLLRSTFVTQPTSQFRVSPEAKQKIRLFAHEVVKINNSNSVITVWPLACVVMLQKLDLDDDSMFRFSELHYGVEQLALLLRKLGVVVNIPETIGAELRYYIRLHDDLFHPMDLDSPDFDLRLIDLPVDFAGAVRREIMERAVSRLVLTTYANTAVEAIFEAGLVATILDKLQIVALDELQNHFVYMQQLLKREFVQVPGQEKACFKEVIETLQKAEIIDIRMDNTIFVRKEDTISLLSKIIMPYISQVAVVVGTILGLKCNVKDANSVVKAAQMHFVRLYELGAGIPVRLSFLSTEPIKNTFNTLIDRGVISKKGTTLEVSSIALEEVFHQLCRFTGGSQSDCSINGSKL